MESFKHVCERAGARQGCLGETDALRRADTFPRLPIPGRGASSRRGPGDPPPPGLAPAQGGWHSSAPASSGARGRASPPRRERTCLVNGQTPERRRSPRVASGGPSGGEGSLAGCSGGGGGGHTRQSPFSPPSRTPGGTAHGRPGGLDRRPRQ